MRWQFWKDSSDGHSLTPLADDVCWRGWEKVQWYAQQAFRFEVQMGKQMEMSE
jgi:hypothetical protein